MDFILVNSLYSDEMLHFAAFHLGLHCLQKYLIRGFQSIKDLKIDVCWSRLLQMIA